jgi:hypothetical protein
MIFVRHERNSSGGTTQCTAQGLSLTGETMPDETEPRFSDSVAMDDLTKKIMNKDKTRESVSTSMNPVTQKHENKFHEALMFNVHVDLTLTT